MHIKQVFVYLHHQIFENEKRGQRPLFYLNNMITENDIRTSVIKAIQGTPLFIVDVKVSPGPKVAVELDSPTGITIGECRSISKLMNEDFDREKEDFELTISSPGLEKPFKVQEQYLKNIGRTVEVELNDGKKINGTLQKKKNESIILEVKEKRKNGKKKEEITELHELKLTDIKQTKVVISFK